MTIIPALGRSLVTLRPGTRLGPYEVTAQIGTGGMGEVYSAKDTTLGRAVAIKVLPEAFAEDEERLARFEREARTLASLNHPNIAIVYGLENSTGVKALVMEIVEGDTLADRIADVGRVPAPVRRSLGEGGSSGEGTRGGPSGLPIDEALAIARQIADALEAAHEQGVVHRDLKPANVKVRPDGTVKVLDFGLAKLRGPSRAAALRDADTASPTVTTPAMTQAGVILGTAAYMSPEQARGRDADARGDVFAFGCVLYEMLTGRRAFAGDDVGETLAFVITKEPDWTLLPATIPTPLRTLLSRCLAKDRRQRLQAIGEARIAIDELLAERRAPNATFRPVPAPHEARSRFTWLKWAGAALSGAAVAALVATLADNQPEPVEIPSTRFTLETPPDVQFMTAGPGQANRFALSADGRNLVFIGRDADGAGLWLRPLGSLDAHELPGTEGAIGAPFWSPDGRAVAFFTTNRLRVIDLAQGTTRTICEIPSLNIGNANAANGTWNTEGTIVFSGDPGAPLRTVPANGSSCTALPIFADRPASELLFLRPRFLPDQQRFLFAARSSTDAELNGVFVASLTDPRTTRVLDRETVAVYASGRLLFVRDGVLMAQPFDVDRAELEDSPRPLGEAAEFASDIAGNVTVAGSILVYSTGVALRTELIAVDRAGKQMDTAAAPAYHSNFELSPDEKRIVIARLNGQTRGWDLWLIDLARQVETRLTFGRGISQSPVWSPDGKTIAFNRNTPLPPSVWLVPADGGPERRLLEVTTGNVQLDDWSPDGKIITFNQSPRLMAVDASGEAAPFAFLETAGANLDESHFSPDGKWIAYNSDESGTWHVYVARFPATGQRWQISSDGGVEPRWRGDGREIYYRTLAGEIVAVSVTPKLPFEAGVPTVLFRANLIANPRSDEYAVTSDGQRFFLKSIAQGDRPALTVVINWDREVGEP